MKNLTLTAVTILLNLTIGFADTIFTSKPNLKAWNPKFIYEVFGDNFNGSSLDQTKWNIDLCKGRGGLPGHSILTSNQGSPDNIQVSNGTLKLLARHEPNNTNNECWQGSFTSNYTTVEIFTKRPEYSYRYCVFEARCKMPRGYGLFPAYWLWGPGTDENSSPFDGYSSEIDIAEAIQKTNEDKFIHAFHWWLLEPGTQQTINDGERNFGTSYLGDWHTYKIIWTPYEVRFYIDEIETWARSKYYFGSNDGWRNDVFANDIQAGIVYKVHEWFPRHICETVLQMQLNNHIVDR
jgi:beta-glucanase (GH16 family)